ncbi:restriction endonuclease subunit S [Desulfocastanea catecholica]
MRSDWIECRLEECMEAIIDYRGKTPQKTTSGIPLITAKIIKEGAIQTVTEFIAEADYNSWMCRGIPKPGDIVLTTEAPLGEVAQLDNRKVALAQRVITLRGKNGLLDNTFLKYLLISHEVQHQLDGRGTGTTVKGIKQSELRQVTLCFPTFAEQKAIAHILGSLDDKIELNRQMNATLESMAQALFKSWFVDFDPVIDNALAAGNPIPEPLHARAKTRKAMGDKRKPLPEAIQKEFPSRFVFSEEMGWLPEGWKVQTLDNMIELIGGGTPKTSIDEYWGGNIPWFSVVDAPNASDVFVINTEKKITLQGLDNSSAKLLPKGTTIISARGTVGKCAVVAKPMAMNQSCYGIRGKNNITDYFVYYTILLRVADLQQRGHGSVFNTITRDTFKTLKTLNCGAKLSASFDKTVGPYMDNILLNIEQSSDLAKLRDTLLPKLLSGKLRVPEAEKLMAEAL